MEIFEEKTSVRFEQPGFLKTPLREHQKVGIGWMIHRESHPFRECRGGLLLDDVGLGKTLQVLGTIYAQKQSGQVLGPTLVVSDRAVMDVWKNELVTHFAEGHTLSILTYHGQKARRDFQANENQAELLRSIDLVFSTYDTMRVERNKDFDVTHIVADEEGHERRHSPFVENSLFLQPFRRIILDEAHKIRNRSASYYQTVVNLKDEYSGRPTIHWGLSAKPVLNRLDDLFPLFQFLNMEPFRDSHWGYSKWRTQIVRPVQYNARSGVKTLHEYMVPVTLRRTKAILHLPELHKVEEEITLQDDEFTFYEKLYTYVRQRVEDLMDRMDQIRAAGGHVDPADRRINSACASVNAMITRLRQCCCAPGLVIKSMRRFEPLLGKPDVLQSCIERIEYILEHRNEIEECAVCMDADADVMAIPCKHLCCQQCWSRQATQTALGFRCPFCRGVMTAQKKVSKKSTEELEADIKGEDTWKDLVGVSSKVDFLLGRLKEQIWDEKIVVVTDFRSFLDIIEKAIRADDILKDVPICRIDGTITGDKRFGVVHAFQQPGPDSPRLLLTTYKCGGEGVTLTAATRLYEMNPWWNEAQMYQAEGRLHRLGQEKSVFIHQLRVAGSIEDNIYEMVDRKGFLSNATLSRSSLAPQKMPWANRVRLMLALDELAPARESKRRRLGTDGNWATTTTSSSSSGALLATEAPVCPDFW